MPIFKLYFQLVKEYRRSIMVYFFIFVILMMIFAFNGSSSEEQFISTSTSFTLIDRDQTELGDFLIDILSQNNTYVPCEDDLQTIENALFYRDVEMVLILPEGFTSSLMDGTIPDLETYQVENSMASVSLKSQINRLLSQLQVYILQGYSLEDAMIQVTDNMSTTATVTMLPSTERDYTVYFYYFHYFPYVMIMVILCGMVPVISSFHKDNIRKRNHCSSYPLFSITLSLTLASLVFGLVTTVLIDFIGILLLGNTMSATSILLTILNTLIQMLVILSIALGLSFFISSSNSINAAANVIGLGSSFLGGIFVPITFLDPKLATISKFIPAYWYSNANMLINETTTYTQSTLSSIYQSYFIQLAFMVLLITIAMAVSKKQYRVA